MSDQRMGQAVSEPNWKSMYIRCVTMFTEVGVRLGLEEPDPEDTFAALDELKERAEKAERELAELRAEAATVAERADEVKKRAQARGENTSALHFRGLARWLRAIAEPSR